MLDPMPNAPSGVGMPNRILYESKSNFAGIHTGGRALISTLGRIEVRTIQMTGRKKARRMR